MTEGSEAEIYDRRRPYVLFGTVVMLMITGGGMFSIVVALKEIALEFDWPRAVPSFAFSMQFIGSGLGGILMGYILDRYGFWVPSLISTVMIGLGGILVSQIDSAWQLYAIYGVMFGLSGQGSLGSPAMANITRWYTKGRGRAVGIAASGQSLAGIIWPPIFGYVMASIGWRDMYFWFGIFAFCTMLPLCFLVRHKPPPYAAPKTATPPPEPTAARQTRLGESKKLSTLAMQSTLCSAIFGCCVAMSLPLAHTVSLVTDLGYPVTDGVEILSVILMASLFSRVVVLGFLSDRLGGLRALLIFSIVQAATLGIFIMVQKLWLLYILAVLFGLGYGGLFPVYAVIVREHLPANQAGRRTGIVMMFGAVAMGFGGWMGGYMFDLTESYTLPYLIGVGFNVVNLAIVLTLISRLKLPLFGRTEPA
ncbi:MAG: MFS transporter [Rhodospirillales bacterium]|nr:MFS transporter [Rhodospirillales bacterium]